MYRSCHTFPAFPLVPVLALFAGLPLAGPLALSLAAAADTALPALPAASEPRDEPVDGAALRQLIEDDWLQAMVEPLSTRSDAAGACDGVKDGKYGFHTGQAPNPWWQVDLGAATPIARIVVYNRLDYAPGLHNADSLRILTSDDGKTWTLRHDNQGRHFGGIQGAKPLEVTFPDGGGPDAFRAAAAAQPAADLLPSGRSRSLRPAARRTQPGPPPARRPEQPQPVVDGQDPGRAVLSHGRVDRPRPAAGGRTAAPGRRRRRVHPAAGRTGAACWPRSAAMPPTKHAGACTSRRAGSSAGWCLPIRC